MMKRKLCVLLAALFAIASFAACGGGATEPAASPGDGSDVAAPGETAAAGGAVTVNYMSLADGVIFETELKTIKRYTDANPGVTVESTSVPQVDGFITALKAKFAAGEEPDVFAFQAGTRVREFAQAGLLKDITDEPYMDRVVEEDKAFNALDGRVYGVPKRFEYSGLFINNEALAQFEGVAIPENFDELMAACETVRAAGMEFPMLLAGKDIGNVSQVDFQYLSTVILPQNPTYYEELMSGERKFSDSFITEMFDKYGKIAEYVSADRLGVDNDEAIKRFIRGDGVFWIAHGTTITRIRELAGPEFDFYMVPSVLQDAGEERYFNCGQARALCVTASSQHPDEVRGMITEMISPESCDIMATEAQVMPALKDCNILPDPSLELCREWFDGDKKTPHADLVWVPGIKDIMKEITQKWLMGDPLEDVLNEWESQHRRLLDTNPDFITNYEGF